MAKKKPKKASAAKKTGRPRGLASRILDRIDKEICMSSAEAEASDSYNRQLSVQAYAKGNYIKGVTRKGQVKIDLRPAVKKSPRKT